MNIRYPLMAAMGLALMGCVASPEAQQKLAEADHNQCASYGYLQGTQAYADCRLFLDQRRFDDMQRRRAALSQGLQNMSNNLNQQAIANRPRQPMNCVTRRGYDNKIYTTCQ